MDGVGQDGEMTLHANPEDVAIEEHVRIDRGDQQVDTRPMPEQEDAEPVDTKPDDERDPDAQAKVDDEESPESLGSDLPSASREDGEDVASSDNADGVDRVDVDDDDDNDDDDDDQDDDSSCSVTAARRSSIAKTPLQTLAFERLPNEIIQQYASLSLT